MTAKEFEETMSERELLTFDDITALKKVRAMLARYYNEAACHEGFAVLDRLIAQRLADEAVTSDLEPIKDADLLELRKLLGEGKYTRWAKNLTVPQIAAVLWLMGEFGVRSTIEDHPLPDAPPGGTLRRVVALRGLIEFQHRPMTYDDALRYIRRGNRREP